MSKRKANIDPNNLRNSNSNGNNNNNSDEENLAAIPPMEPTRRRHVLYQYSIPAGYLNNQDIRHGDIIELIPDAQAGNRQYIVIVNNNKKRVKLIYDAEWGFDMTPEEALAEAEAENEAAYASESASASSSSSNNHSALGGRRKSRKARKGSRKVRKARRDRKTRRDRKNRRK